MQQQQMANQSTPRSSKKERRVSVVFRKTEDPLHCAGVEALYLLPDTGSLLTASRDSTIRRWDVTSPQPRCQGTYAAHADWVNDLALYQELLFSCSNDRTVRVWQADSPGTLLSTMIHHSDYVTCLAAAQHKPVVASGGLRGEVFFIDVAAGATHRLRPKLPLPPPPSQASPPRPSGYNGQPGMAADMNGAQPSVAKQHAGIYSLCINASGNILAAGSSDHMIRLWDTRSGEKISKLRGHTDNVRCLLLKDDCSLMLSGAADGTMKLWDLNMQRCIQTYVVHADSVWSMSVSPDWSQVYSGGRDKCVYRTHLASRTAELMLQHQHPISCIAVDHQAGSLWVSSPRSTVYGYQVPKDAATSRGGGTGIRARVLGASHSLRKSVDALHSQAPVLTQPSAVIEGLPAIMQHKVLSDRRRILTKDDQGEVALWDVLQGRETARFGKVELDAQEGELFEPRHCPSWFAADNKLGLMCISLEPPQCFNAEEYAQALGYADAPDDHRLNYGKLVLEAVFAKWKHKALQLQQGGPGSPEGAGPLSPGASMDSAQQHAQHADVAPRSGGALAANVQQQLHGSPQQQTQQQQPVDTHQSQAESYYTESWPRYWQGVHPMVMCQSANGVPWCCVMDQFTGRESEPQDIPSWVGDIVLRNAVVTPKESKCAFLLLPAEGSNLPSLLQSRLHAPRILQVHKVAAYCGSKLEEQSVQWRFKPAYLKRPAQAPPEPDAVAGRHELELVCNNLAVPWEMSLSSVKKFIWCKSEDIVFHYRLRNPAHPAPLPTLGP